jgi:hypothetical protein
MYSDIIYAVVRKPNNHFQVTKMTWRESFQIDCIARFDHEKDAVEYADHAKSVD